MDLAHRIESVELSHGQLRPHLPAVSNQEPVDPSLCELVYGLASCPRTDSSGQRVLPIGLLYGRIHEARADKDVSSCWSRPWQKVRHWTFAMHMASCARAFIGGGQELRFGHIGKQNRSVSSTRLSSQAYAWRPARVWCQDLLCRQGSLIRTLGLGGFFQAHQQVQAVAQTRKARRSHPSLLNLGQDPLALRVVWLFLVEPCFRCDAGSAQPSSIDEPHGPHLPLKHGPTFSTRSIDSLSNSQAL